MSILKPVGLICSRYTVKQLAENNPDVETVDFSSADIVGVSTMHEFLIQFPSAEMAGLEGFNKQTFEWVMEAINSEEFKRNSQR